MTPLEQRLSELLDRHDISDLLSRYGVAIDSRQWDLLDTVFTPDATIDYSSSGAPKGSYPRGQGRRLSRSSRGFR